MGKNKGVKAEMKKAKTISEKSAVVKHEVIPLEVPKCGKLLHVETNVNNKDMKGIKSEKRNKVSLETETYIKLIEEPKSKKNIFVDDEPQEVPNKKSKKTKKVLQETANDSKVIDEPKQLEVPSKKSKKRSKLLRETEQDLKGTDELKQQVVPSKKSKKRDNGSEGTKIDSKVILESKGKKIVFVDDEIHKVTSSLGKVDNTDKKKKFLNDDEAEVREEDIDKFCDELDEKDNAQYEEWVKLIEANFHSNTKKSK